MINADPRVKVDAFDEAFLTAKERYKKMNPFSRAIQIFTGKLPNKSWWITAQAKYMDNQQIDPYTTHSVELPDIPELVAILQGETVRGDFDRNDINSIDQEVMIIAEREWGK